MSRRKPQLSLFSNKERDYFGGRSLRNAIGGGNHARTKRTLSSKHWIHICMRSELARERWSLSGSRGRIEALITRQAKRCGIRIRECVVMSNHIHLIVMIGDRTLYANWIRSISGQIARIATGAERGNRTLKRPFWDSKPFSRVIRGWAGLKIMTRYALKNEIERTAPRNLDQETIRMIADSFLRWPTIEPPKPRASSVAQTRFALR